MQKSPIPPSEATRQSVLEKLGLLDTGADPVLDGLVRSAAAVAGCPISLVSLIDRDRQWFKARVGVEATETPRDVAFCSHAIVEDALFEVPDATRDARFDDNPLVTGDPHIRFYAGVPINVEGENVGTLCVIDRRARALTDVQRQLLADLGRAVEHWIEGEQRNKALQAAERHHRELFEHLRDAVMLLDDDHAILDANPAAVKLFGYPRGTLLQLRLHNLVDESEARWLREHAAPGKPRKRHRVQWSCVSRTGRRFAAEVHARRIDERRYLSSIRDVEERNAIDERLRQLYLAVEQSTESIVSTDLSGCIVYVNPATIAMSGYDRDELIGQNARILGAGKTPPETFAALYARLRAGKPWSGMMLNRRKDGEDYQQSATITPLRATNGRITHYVAVMKDVTEERRMTAQLVEYREHLEELVDERTRQLALATRAAEAANAAKSGFLATMSHEIRTPMNGVVGVLDILRRSPLSAYQLDLVETMGESAFALLGIIDDVLDFSKIEAGRLGVEREPVDITMLIESVCFGLKPIARNREVALHLFVDPLLPDRISTDPVRVRQILTNLVGNAIKFSAGAERRGRVSVRATRTTDDALLLTVADNGIGIPEEAQTRIFQPFEQAEGPTSRSFGGTGLGLSICKRLCDLLGGSIEVRSAPGEGARFMVTLPLEAVAGPPKQPASTRLAGVHCKLICPNPEVRDDWAIYLTSAGAQVETVENFAALRQSLARSPVFVCVAVIDARDDALPLTDLDALRASFSLLMVVIGSGQSREPRIVNGGSVFLGSRLVFRESLLRAIELAVGFESVVAAPPDPATAEPVVPSIASAVAQGRLILVAEDNQINQKVIRTQLGLLGYAAEVVGSGHEALALWRSGRYGLLLTDVHMPGLDGYALARAIRDEERPPARLPIVALTANTLAGEAARCRAAGMDECMTKPVQLDALSRMLAQWLPGAPRTSAPVATVDPVDGPGARPASVLPVLDATVLDATVLAALVGDDPDVIAEFQRDFRHTVAAARRDLHHALDGDDWAAVGEIVHRVKSSARSVGAFALGACCERIEEAADRPADRDASGTLADFDAAIEALEQALAGDDGVATLAPVVAAPKRAVGIAILDDEPAEIERTTAQLADCGVHPLVTWTQGRQALEWLRGCDTTGLLVLIDLNMAGMDGIDFMRRLAEQGFLGRLAIISGADSRVIETAAKLGEAQGLTVLGHYRKPLGVQTLQELIARWHGFSPAALRGAARKYTANEVLRGVVNNEMVLHYQPKVALRDGSLHGVEALVRWQHPVDGLVPPGAFVGVVEAHGGVDMLTATVISLALAQSRTWNDTGMQQCIAINVSMLNLLRLDFPELLIAEAERHGVPPTDIRLEVTESRLMSDLRSQIGSLTRLRLKGVGLSIDDFGTGHSSLSQLRDIPFDELKIDRSFVHGSGGAPTQSAIFSASLGMAHDLRMKVVAEGVEDRADWDFVRKSGVDYAQGYFIARPMPAADLPAWLAQWEARAKELL